LLRRKITVDLGLLPFNVDRIDLDGHKLLTNHITR